ncbi:tetratricopeptide repeat protein, partial [Nostoc sp.]|uniref:CHAT domain-containing protein n=1 Tax=Nostoc sp. TaxID=1180 RepID=UPI003593832E
MLFICLSVLITLLISLIPFRQNLLAISVSPPAQITTPETADRLFEQGIEYYQAKQLQLAIQFWQQSLTAYRTLKDRPAQAATLKNLSAVYLLLPDHPKAIAYLQQYLNITRELGDHLNEENALVTLADTYVKANSYTKAIEYYQQSLKIIQQLSNSPQEKQRQRSQKAVILGNLAIAYRVVGNYSAAIEFNHKALQIFRELKDYQTQGKVLGNLGNAYQSLGDYDNAIASYQESLNIVQTIKDNAQEGVILGYLGAIYANLGQYDNAIAFHKQSLKINQSIGDSEGQSSTLINLGSTYHSLRQGDKARTYYQQALELASSAGDRKREGEALGSLGLVYEDSHDYPKAIQYQEQALAIARTIGDPEAEGKALNNFGHALFAAGKLKEAEDKLRAAVKLLDGLRPGLDDTYKVSIFDTQVYTYNLLQQILVAANKPEASLEAAEQGRARAFADLLARRMYQEGEKQKSVSSITDNPPPSIEKIRQIARQQNATLVEYAIVPDDDFKFRGKQRGREQELFIWVVQPSGKVAFRRVDLRPLWQKGGTLADVINISHCFTLDRSANVDKCLSKPAGKGEQLMQALRQMKPAQAAKSSSKSQDFRQILHQLLIQPIADLLPVNPDAHIIFIPQETLFSVPFPALQDTNGKYLIEKHTILTAPSIQVLDLTRNLKDKRRMAGGKNSSIFSSPASALIVGNPVMPKPLEQLPQAEQEALDIAKLFKTTAIIGAQATKANILEKLPKARLVHLATHGLLEYGNQNTDLGVPGAIALAPSLKDDGFLTASEILNLRLNAELVVLSACKTGRGRISGDGV